MRIFCSILFAAFLLNANTAFSQILGWQFTLPNPSTGREIAAKATTNHDNLEKSILTRGSTATPGPGSMRGFNAAFPIQSSKEEAISTGSYYQFNVSAKKGSKVSLSSLNAVIRRQAESPYKYQWMYSINGSDFVNIGEELAITDLNGWGVTQPSIDLSKHADLQNLNSDKKVMFRIYTWGGVTDKGHEMSFGFGKSKINGSNVLSVNGTITPEN